MRRIQVIERSIWGPRPGARLDYSTLLYVSPSGSGASYDNRGIPNGTQVARPSFLKFEPFRREDAALAVE